MVDAGGGTKSSSNVSRGLSPDAPSASVSAGGRDAIEGRLLSSDLSAAAGASSIESVSALFPWDDMRRGRLESKRLSRETVGDARFNVASSESNSISKLDPEPASQGR